MQANRDSHEHDIIIIGAGVIGAMVARFLARYDLDIVWIEKDNDICTGATSANSAIIHGGYAAPPGTLKAEMNARAINMWDQLAAELNFGFSRCGTYVVAIGDEEHGALKIEVAHGADNGIPVELISGEEMRRREPLVNPETTGALYCPVAGICDPWGATIAAAENAVMNGVTLRRNTCFEDFIWDEALANRQESDPVGQNPRRIIGIKTNQGNIYGSWIVNAAGVYSDHVMHLAGVRPDFNIRARRGEYHILDRNRFALNSVLFPVPTKVSKGIVITTTVHGNAIVGPNAEDLEDKEDTAVTAAGLDEVWNGAHKLVPSISKRDVIAVFAGLRPGGNAPSVNPAVAYKRDFIIEIPNEVRGLVNLGGIESPGLTAAPAIAERVVELLQTAGQPLQEKPDWDPIRPARPVFRHLSHGEQAALVKQDPRYGRVICRCENVTEGEIVAEIHAPIPADTYDAIKRRTWLGTGRCQGSFDMPRVVDILSRELGLDPLEVSKKGPGSGFLTRTTKSLDQGQSR